jgi:hypothetical protein
VTFVGNFSGNQNGCPNGGAIFAAGSVNAYVCNGQNAIEPARADGPCFNNTHRYVNCGNGTVTDTVTGLIWLQQANCFANHDWAAANVAAAGLKNGDCGLTDKSSPGDWRLPTQAEWTATVARTVGAGSLGCTFLFAPSLTNDAGTGCYLDGSTSSLTGVAADKYWSSTTFDVSPGAAFYRDLLSGTGSAGPKGNTFLVWPVRGGPR